MQKKISYFLFFLTVIAGIALLTTSCTEKINLKLGDTYTRLVVEGSITSDTLAHEIRLTKTADFFSNQPAPPVTGATVSITDGSQTFSLTEDLLHPGIYHTAPNIYGQAGKTYTLMIQLANAINGYSEYTARCQMPPVGKIDSIGIVYHDTWKVWEIQCWAYDPPTVNYYMFNTFKNHILMTDTIDKVIVTDDRLFNGSYTNGVGVGYLRKEISREVVNPGDTLTIQIAGITKDYMTFIQTVQIESGYQNPLTSGPPANITGNISNGAIGFFTAYSVKYASTIAK